MPSDYRKPKGEESGSVFTKNAYAKIAFKSKFQPIVMLDDSFVSVGGGSIAKSAYEGKDL